MNSRKLKDHLFTGFKTGILLLFLLFFMLPIVWVALTSIKRPVDQMAIPPVWFPEQPVFDSYLTLFHNPDFVTSLVNSLRFPALPR